MFFNSDMANNLQQWAVFVEALGITLVAIELWFKAPVKRWEKSFDSFESSLPTLRELTKNVRVEKSHFQADKPVIRTLAFLTAIPLTPIAYYVSFWITFICYILMIGWTCFFYLGIAGARGSVGIEHGEQIENDEVMLIFGHLIFFGTIGAAILSFTLISPIKAMMSFLNRISNGHAFGGLGLILAAVGLSFELYQLGELCTSDGCYKWVLTALQS